MLSARKLQLFKANAQSALKTGEAKSKTFAEGMILLFLIHPFTSFILAISHLKNKYSFLVIFLFFVLFGFTFIAQNTEADSYRYVLDFNSYQRTSTHQYLNDIRDFFTFDSRIKDIYAISSYYIISRFSDNYHFLFALWAVVFSFFFLKSFRFFVDRPEFIRSLVTGLLAFLFIFSNNIFNINGVRFNTAAWIAVYAVFEIVVNKKYKYFLLAMITPLMHIAFASFVAILLLYMISAKLNRMWVIIFFVSFFISEVSIVLVENYRQQLPPALQTMVWEYAFGENYQNRIDSVESIPLYAKILLRLPRYFINLLMFVFIFKSKQIRLFPEASRVFSFLLVWITFTNITIAVPSFGERFFVIAIPLLTYLCLLIYKKIPVLNKLIYLIPVVYAYIVLYWVRDMITVTDPTIFSLFPHILIRNFLFLN